MRKINSNSYGGKWIGIGLLLGIIIPGITWLICHVILLWSVMLGALVLMAFVILFLIEMHQDNGKRPFFEKNLAKKIPFDPNRQEAVIKCSICTGEKMAGFMDKSGGHFTEVMLIKSEDDEKQFKKIYGLKQVKKEY